MKAVSIPPDDAKAVLDGKVRSFAKVWRTSHRGSLLLVAAAHGGPGKGVVVGSVNLVDCRPVGEQGISGEWHFTEPRRLPERPCHTDWLIYAKLPRLKAIWDEAHAGEGHAPCDAATASRARRREERAEEREARRKDREA